MYNPAPARACRRLRRAFTAAFATLEPLNVRRRVLGVAGVGAVRVLLHVEDGDQGRLLEQDARQRDVGGDARDDGLLLVLVRAGDAQRRDLHAVVSLTAREA